MRDWQAVVRERLSGRGLTSAQQDEVVTELAAHLEDLYEELRAQGEDESDAIRRALDEVTDWRRLSRQINRAKQREDHVKNRAKNLWIPGLICGFVTMSSLSLLSHAGFQPRIILMGANESLQLPIPWLLMLPFFGALGAYLSRRADGPRITRVAAALFPAIVLLGLLFLSALVSVFVDRNVRTHPLPYLFGLIT
ncbi:MAG TPA: permease prefix domain 1-containing protein, partial [Candidatus Acidoferrum sp.]|nr:permease prefix domain 1-containing protein [Candidatus Acidoferrum sp.]